MKQRVRQGGFFLVTVYGLLALTLMHGAVLMTQAVVDIRSSQRALGSAQGFYLSEAALDSALQWIRARGAPPPGTARMVLFGGWQAVNEGSYLAVVDPDDNNPNSFVKRYTLEGWGVSGPTAAPVATRTTRIIVQSESFSRYAYFTHADTSPSGSHIWFITGDRIEGPAHTNGRFNMYGRPVFDGPVTSVSSTINLWRGGPPTTDPVFNGTLSLGVDTIDFPGSLPTALIRAAGSGGALFNGDTRITLLPDGTMRVTNNRRGIRDQVMPVPPNGALYVERGSVSVEGTLKGRLTIGAERDVKITDSVTYASDPRVDPESEDLMGIVAGRDVKVTNQAPVDVEIDASIMALGSSFGVENWNAGPPRGTLTVLGGIIQRFRGPVGTFNSSSGRKVSGYTKDYHYDTRLRDRTPPFFPVTGNYSTVVWGGEEGS